MNLNEIHNEEEYDQAVKKARELTSANPRPDSPEGRKLEILLLMLNKYEGQKSNNTNN